MSKPTRKQTNGAASPPALSPLTTTSSPSEAPRARQSSESSRPGLLDRFSSLLRNKSPERPVRGRAASSNEPPRSARPAPENVKSEPAITTTTPSPVATRAGRARSPRRAPELDANKLSPPSSPARRPLPLRRSSTSPIPSHVSVPLPRVHKRLIVCCDGTWQDGIVLSQRWMYSNVLKLARALDHEDERHNPPIPQIVFYQSGLGSDNNLYSHVVDGAFGTHLAEKVQEAYAFLAQNYHPGDEIFLFGFSRGAYTARMVSTFIGELGLLNRDDMDNFADIFIAYQKRGKTDDPKKNAEYNEYLAKYENPMSDGKKKMTEAGPFAVKCVGVFDTVGSLGLPAELMLSPKVKTLFGFPDKVLPEHIERVYHAMALDEHRQDFEVTKYFQSPKGREKGQILQQCWFTGDHTDIGGGWQDHDLSDLTLAWMMAHVEDILAIDLKYLKALPRPVKPWGKQGPHYSNHGIFRLGGQIQRTISTDPRTCESIHKSVLEQSILAPSVVEALNAHPEFVRHLLPLEEEMRSGWAYVPGQTPARQDSVQARIEVESQAKAKDAIVDAAKKAAKMGKSAMTTVTGGDDGGDEAHGSVVEQMDENGKMVVPRAGSRYEADSSMSKIWEELTG